MRTLGILFVLLALVVGGVALANRWDGTFQRSAVIAATNTLTLADAGTVTIFDAGNNCATLPNGAYVKVACAASDGGPIDTYVGVGAADGGASCLLADAGIQCDLIRFSLGEKFFAQLPAAYAIAHQQAQVCILQAFGVSPTCTVFVDQTSP